MYTLIMLFGIAATVLFLAGFAVGLKNAIVEYRSGAPEPSDVPDYRYGGLAAISVLASALFIALPGFGPMWIYAGPLLALVTAAGCGIAFFAEKPPISS